MDRRMFSLSLVGSAVASLTGCFHGGDDNVVIAGPELATATNLPATTMFLQSLVATDTQGHAAPGQANYWGPLNRNFSIEDGSTDQFDSALRLEVDVAGNGENFPQDQVYAELTAFGPELGVDDGVKLVSFSNDPLFVVSGATSAVLHPVPDARLQQVLNLTTAVAPIALTWGGNDKVGRQSFADEPFFLQVVIRDTAGALLATLFRHDNAATIGGFGAADLSAFAGQTVVLSFEQRSSSATEDDGPPPVNGCTNIDDVSVVDRNAAQFVTNGGFEAGGTGWTVPVVKVAQNVRSGTRTLNGLEVQRSLFAQPNQLWGRMTDVFFNPTASAIDAIVTYKTNLGSDDSGIIYDTPGAVGKSLTTWNGDSSDGDRDAGLVFGAADVVTFTSDTALNASNGSDDIFVRFNVSVPAGGRVTLVNFVVLTGTRTVDTAVDITARATQVDTAALDIVTNFRTNFLYQRGMTQQQLDSLKNF